MWGAVADTALTIVGISLKTTHVGVAFVGIGLITTYLAFRGVLKSQLALASLPPEKPQPSPSDTPPDSLPLDKNFKKSPRRRK
jgi:hypothetical protein